jgi:RNA polymerase sigma factor (sigma-70 family)
MSEPLTVQIQGALDRFLSGDEAGKKELITLADQRLMILARKQLGRFGTRPDETAGVVNEAYLKLHKALDEVRPKTVREFFALAALQIQRVLLDMARSVARRRKGKVSIDDSEGGGEPADQRAAGRSHVDRMIDLHAAIDQLPDDLKEVVRLHFFQGLTYDTIAAVIDVHPDTVKRMVLRAKVKLARELDGFGLSDG